MPYQIKEEGDKFCVYNLDTDKKMGEFDTRRLAMQKMKALYATEKKGETEPDGMKDSAAEDAGEKAKD